MSDAAEASGMAALAERVRAGRRRWVQLTERLAVCVERPGWAARAEMASLRGVALVQHLLRHQVVDWRGFTAADADPAMDATPLPFDPALWCLLADDREDWIAQVVDAVHQARAAHDQAAETAAGN